MQIYATTTTERASKGQGGNDFLEINVTDANKNTILELEITPKGDMYEIKGYAIDNRKDGRRSESYIHHEVTKS